VTTAANADEAVELARRSVFDVVIVDVSPPGPCAIEVLRRMRAEDAAPRRVVAVSNAPLDRREADKLGTVLPKPYPFDHLLRAVFGEGRRRRTRSGVFPRLDPAAPSKRPGPRVTRGARAADRGGRGRGE
jgi:DNA-binding response OmpR family regulator